MKAKHSKTSAGILLFRVRETTLEVLLAHPGGPFWAKKDNGAWSIPKGEYEPPEETQVAAKREFAEEVGSLPEGDLLPLSPRKQPSGKIIAAWALNGDFDITNFSCNMFEMEWPPKSGKVQQFPELDRIEWFRAEEARQKILTGQIGFIDELEALLLKEGVISSISRMLDADGTTDEGATAMRAKKVDTIAVQQMSLFGEPKK